jgi:uncharacterized protein (TIGR03083 family)
MGDPTTMAAIAAAYNAGRDRISELVRELDTEASATPVPACPEWSVKDVVSHLTGICHDLLNGNLDGVATEPWTAAQVDARRHLDIDEIVAEWSALGAQVEAMVPSFPEGPAAQLVGDLATHEHDVRGALERPGARDSDAVVIGLGFVAKNFCTAVAARGFPALRLRAGDSVWSTGTAEADTTVSAEPFELLRALTGRRSESQLRALAWEGDPSEHLAAFTWGPFSVPASPIIE